MEKVYAIVKDGKIIKKGYGSESGVKKGITSLAKKEMGIGNLSIAKVEEITRQEVEVEIDNYDYIEFIPKKELTLFNWIKNKMGWL